MKFEEKYKLKNSRAESLIDIQFAKDIIGLAKDILEVIWKSAPMALLPAGFVVWSYLRTIQWVDLFGESTLSGTGLVFLVLAAIMMAFFVIVVFLIPSLFMIGVIHIFNSNLKLSKETVVLYYWALVGWTFALFANLVFEFTMLVYLASPTIVAFSVGVWKLRRNIASQGLDHFCKLIIRSLANTFGANFSMAGTIFPLIVTLKLAAVVPEYSNQYPYVSFAVCFLVSILGIIPGFAYLNIRAMHEGGTKAFKIAAYGTVFSSYLMMTLVFAFLPVSSMVLEVTGVYSNEESTFQILKDDLPGVLKKAGLSVEKGDGISTVKGFVRFNFGGVRLLCKTSFDPRDASLEARRAAARDKKPDPMLSAGQHCVPTQSSELRKFKM